MNNTVRAAEQPTLEQRRALHAWKAIQALPAEDKATDNYAREAKRLPLRIMTAGLGQALAFLDAKRGSKPGSTSYYATSPIGRSAGGD